MKSKYVIVFTFLITTFSFAQQKNGSIDKIIEEDNSKIAKSELSVSTSLPNAPTSVVTYDFTTSASKYYGGAAAAAILEINGADTTWGMVAGDVNQDGQITTLDYDIWLPNAKAALTGYENSDINLDGQNTTLDYDIWLPNAKNAKQTQVPN